MSCCKCCCCCCENKCILCSVNLLDLFLGVILLGSSVYLYIEVNPIGKLVQNNHFEWIIYGNCVLGLFYLLNAILSIFATTCNKRNDAEINRIRYKEYKSNILFYTACFGIIMILLNIIYGAAIYFVFDEWFISYLKHHVSSSHLNKGLSIMVIQYFGYFYYLLLFQILLQTIRFRCSFNYYDYYSGLSHERDIAIMKKRLKRESKEWKEELIVREIEEEIQVRKEVKEILQSQKLIDEEAAIKKAAIEKKEKAEAWAKKLEYDKQMKEKLKEEKKAALAKKKRWFGTDILIDSLNQQSLKLFGVKVGIAYDAPDPKHIGKHYIEQCCTVHLLYIIDVNMKQIIYIYHIFDFLYT